jgi:Fe-S-cluster containining protein
MQDKEKQAMQENNRREAFECQRCGRCCTVIGLPYDPKAVDEISRFLGLTVDTIIERYYGRFNKDRKTWISERHKRTPCPFIMTIGDIKACAIYPVRPNACRQYPFAGDWTQQGIECPGSRNVNAASKKEGEGTNPGALSV